MTGAAPYYASPSGDVVLHRGDATAVLRALPAGSVHTVITSPPYFALRDYQTATWEGGDAGCDHVETWNLKRDSPGGFHNSTTRGEQPATKSSVIQYRAVCGKCGARRVDAQIGLEPDPERYVAALVAVFREVWRVLRDDGTLWLNLGDSYAAHGRMVTDAPPTKDLAAASARYKNGPSVGRVTGFPRKGLMMIPSRVAIALQEDGWLLRAMIPWLKRSAMPESATDRPTTATEYVFLLAKSERYFYDADAVRVPQSAGTFERYGNGKAPRKTTTKAYAANEGEVRANAGFKDATPEAILPNGRNRRNADWWFDSLRAILAGATGLLADEDGAPLALPVNPAAYPGAHFACVDEETEALTADGWKRHDQINPGDLAVQFDIGSGTLSWGRVEAVARYPVVDQPMVAAKSRDVEMLLTPNHRTIIQRRKSSGDRTMQPPVVIEASGLKTQHGIPVSARWAYEAPRPFSDDWAELLGWYIAEGCETGYRWTVEIYQSHSANPGKVERIRQLLQAVGAEFTEARAERIWRGSVRTCVAFQVRGFAATMLRQWAPAKRFHPDTLLWPDETLTRLLAGLVDGDGHRRADDGRTSFIQRDECSAGIAQAIGVRLGYATMLSRRSGQTYTVYFTRKRYITLRGTAGEGAKIETQPYTGIVWCPSLPAGTWVARKNGRAFITGNTFPPKLVEPMILASTSARGCCPACGAPRTRVTEREGPTTREKLAARGASAYSAAQPVSAQGLDYAGGHGDNLRPVRTTGWRAGCACADAGDPIPAVVLDPFAGACTTGLVARKHGRHFVGIDLSEPYLEMGRERLGQLVLPGWSGAAAGG
jgi:DNA modification methylase